jgi:hypothetical protein
MQFKSLTRKFSGKKVATQACTSQKTSKECSKEGVIIRKKVSQ